MCGFRRLDLDVIDSYYWGLHRRLCRGRRGRELSFLPLTVFPFVTFATFFATFFTVLKNVLVSHFGITIGYSKFPLWVLAIVYPSNRAVEHSTEPVGYRSSLRTRSKCDFLLPPPTRAFGFPFRRRRSSPVDSRHSLFSGDDNTFGVHYPQTLHYRAWCRRLCWTGLFLNNLAIHSLALRYKNFPNVAVALRVDFANLCLPHLRRSTKGSRCATIDRR